MCVFVSPSLFSLPLSSTPNLLFSFSLFSGCLCLFILFVSFCIAFVFFFSFPRFVLFFLMWLVSEQQLVKLAIKSWPDFHAPVQ